MALEHELYYLGTNEVHLNSEQRIGICVLVVVNYQRGVENGVDGVVVTKDLPSLPLFCGCVVDVCSEVSFIPNWCSTHGTPNSVSHPMVADGTMSVKGRISSTKLTYLRFGATSSYMAMMNMVCTGAHATSNPSPTTGNR